jgi:hypothetical protein
LFADNNRKACLINNLQESEKAHLVCRQLEDYSGILVPGINAPGRAKKASCLQTIIVSVLRYRKQKRLQESVLKQIAGDTGARSRMPIMGE